MENASKVMWCWLEQFYYKTPRLAAVYDLQDKFEFTGVMTDASMAGRSVCVTAGENQL